VTELLGVKAGSLPGDYPVEAGMITQLTGSLLRWGKGREEQRAGSVRAQTIAVCSRKGGVGKTTTAAHLAYAAARWYGQQVLLIDLDSQGHVSSILASLLDEVGASSEPLSLILSGRRRDLMEAAQPTLQEGLWVVPADRGMADAEMLLASRIGREFLLRNTLARAREIFDLIIIDCPPNLGTMTLNALVAADSALVPTDLSSLSLQGITDLTDAVGAIQERMGHFVRLAGIVVTRRDGRTRRLNTEMEGELAARYGNLVFDTAIPMNSAVARACARGMTVFQHAPRAAGAIGYRGLTRDLLQRLSLTNVNLEQ